MKSPRWKETVREMHGDVRRQDVEEKAAAWFYRQFEGVSRTHCRGVVAPIKYRMERKSFVVTAFPLLFPPVETVYFLFLRTPAHAKHRLL